LPSIKSVEKKKHTKKKRRKREKERKKKETPKNTMAPFTRQARDTMIRNAIHFVETNEEIKTRLLGIPKISRDVRVCDVKLGQRVQTRRHTFRHE